MAAQKSEELLLNDIVTLDGIKNTRAGHDASATTWQDISGNGNDFARDGSAGDMVWGTDHAVFDATKRVVANFTNLWANITELTIECVASISGNGSTSASGAYIGFLFTNYYDYKNDAGIFRINSYNNTGFSSHYNNSSFGYAGLASFTNPIYIAYVFSGSNVKRYVNGTLQQTITSAFPPSTSLTSFRIGGGSSKYYFNGNVYRIGMSSEAMSASDIASRYAFFKNRFNLP